MSDEKFIWKVLAVDDDQEKLNDLENVLSSRMENNAFEFTKVTSFTDSTNNINDRRYDFVFLDVHEESEDPDPATEPGTEDQRGEKLLKHIQSLRFLPVIFYTGYPTKVKHLESIVVRIVDKGSPIDEIRNAVNAILDTKLPHLLRHLEEQSRAYIWDSLQPIIVEPNDGEKIDPHDISLLLARRLASSLSQRVVREILEMDTNVINPLEMYLYPSADSNFNPADICKEKDHDNYWMVFTPACDFAQNKAEHILLSKIIPLNEHDVYKTWLENKASYDAIPSDGDNKAAHSEMKNARGTVKALVKNKSGERYKFLPGTFFLRDCVVDFQDLLSIPKSDSSNYKIVCSLDNPYREEMLHFFSRYYGRIGTPDYSFSPVWDRIERIFSGS